ncbi:MAG: hypothetical protein J6R99_00810 [Alphaproteobacteria bacterium]|nr:hypothetical protein [Alphaproteobacteria bacterium]
MIETIESRLKSLGYEADNNDIFALQFVLTKVENHVKNFCNIDTIPAELEQLIVDKTCGEFLAQKKASGQLTGAQIEGVVKKIQDGDTTVEFAGNTDAETVFGSYINNLVNGHDECLLRYRRLVW